MAQLCPWCGSDATAIEQQSERIGVPFGPTVEFLVVTNTCERCGESGDFARVNDSAIVAAKDLSIKASVPLMVDEINKSQNSAAYMERALELPARTIARWKTEGTSAAAVALLRVVTTFPWLLEVADNRFHPDLAKAILVREAGKALVASMKEQRVTCLVATTTGKNSATVSLTLSKAIESSSTPGSAIQISQLPSGESNARS